MTDSMLSALSLSMCNQHQEWDWNSQFENWPASADIRPLLNEFTRDPTTASAAVLSDRWFTRAWTFQEKHCASACVLLVPVSHNGHVHTLGAQAFNTTGTQGTTLKDILQDEKIPNVFFDVRNDSDALFAHFGVALQGVEDVQLIESATRKTTASRKFLNGLAKCIENNGPTSVGGSGLASWKAAKEKGERLFKAEYGGSYDVFNQRPIPEDIASYCVGDVQYLPELPHRFYTPAGYQWRDLVGEETKKRVRL